MRTLLPLAIASLVVGFVAGYFARDSVSARQPSHAAPAATGPGDATSLDHTAMLPEDLSESQREIVRLRGQLDLLLATLDAHDRINLLKVLERLQKLETETRTQRDQLNDALGNPAGGAIVTLRFLDGEVSRRETELKDLETRLADLWVRLARGRENPAWPDYESQTREIKRRAEERRKVRRMQEDWLLDEVRRAKTWEEFYKFAREFEDEELLEYAIAERLSGELGGDDLQERVHLDSLVDDEQAAVTAEVVRFCGTEDELLRRAAAGGAVTAALHIEIRRIRAEVRSRYGPFYRMWFSDRELETLSAQLRTEAPPEVFAEGPATAPGTRRVRVGGGLGP
ncbi:MAG: hypothetical protein HYY18_08300 [Planctomycetes bacterium]|nr:hypothetical protein [Planctomycetota bacterium]